MSTAFLFPGQGSQTPGMAAAFMGEPATRALFQEADDILGFKLSALMRDGPEDTLRLTENAQPALLLAGIVACHYALRNLNKPLHEIASFVAGHSLGEYAAVAAAGGLRWTAALKLVRLRGEAMARAVPPGRGGMSAILGMEMAMVESLARSTHVFVANDNAPGQVILSGPLDSLRHAENEARNHGARKVVSLNVAGPFHTPAMKPAADAVHAALEANPLQTLTVPAVMNASAAAHRQPAEVAANLVAQITGPVRWRESMSYLADHAVTEVVELGAGKVLSAMAPRCDARLSAISLDSPRAVDAWLAARVTA